MTKCRKHLACRIGVEAIRKQYRSLILAGFSSEERLRFDVIASCAMLP